MEGCRRLGAVRDGEEAGGPGTCPAPHLKADAAAVGGAPGGKHHLRAVQRGSTAGAWAAEPHGIRPSPPGSATQTLNQTTQNTSSRRAQFLYLRCLDDAAALLLVVVKVQVDAALRVALQPGKRQSENGKGVWDTWRCLGTVWPAHRAPTCKGRMQHAAPAPPRLTWWGWSACACGCRASPCSPAPPPGTRRQSCTEACRQGVAAVSGMSRGIGLQGKHRRGWHTGRPRGQEGESHGQAGGWAAPTCAAARCRGSPYGRRSPGR